MRKTDILFTITAFALAGGAASATSAATIADYSFEQPYQGGGYTYNPTVTDATFTGGAGVQANGSAWGFADAPDGSQTGFLQNNAETDLLVSGLSAGSTYSLSFFDSQRPGYGILPITVEFDGATILTTTPGASWSPVNTANFVASGSTGTVSFITTAIDGDNDSGIDGITVSGAVPEPATWALMLVGFGGLGAVARLRRSPALAV